MTDIVLNPWGYILWLVVVIGWVVWKYKRVNTDNKEIRDLTDAVKDNTQKISKLIARWEKNDEQRNNL